ncbi:hypothetical protein TNCV_608291 [Trichonephila clavipes]|nr:hypothetical protein TNCV_608291 [Trichonephila clavipes]
MRAGRSSTGVYYTSKFKWLQKKKSKGLRSGERGDQATGTTIERSAGVPSCRNPAFWCAVAGILCSNSERRGNFAYVQVSSTLPRHSAFVWPLLWLHSMVTIITNGMD